MTEFHKFMFLKILLHEFLVQCTNANDISSPSHTAYFMVQGVTSPCMYLSHSFHVTIFSSISHNN